MELTEIKINVPKNIIQLAPEWFNLIQYVRENVSYGELTVKFKDGKPFEATAIKQSIRF